MADPQQSRRSRSILQWFDLPWVHERGSEETGLTEGVFQVMAWGSPCGWWGPGWLRWTELSSLQPWFSQKTSSRSAVASVVGAGGAATVEQSPWWYRRALIRARSLSAMSGRRRECNSNQDTQSGWRSSSLSSGWSSSLLATSLNCTYSPWSAVRYAYSEGASPSTGG